VIETEIAATEIQIAGTLQKEAALQEAIKTARDHAQDCQRNQHVLEAEIASLAKIQQSMRDANNESSLASWLKSLGLNNNTRFWQMLGIKAGWETALEAVLGSRLNAVAHSQTLPETRPPSALSIAFSKSLKASAVVMPSRYASMLSLIERVEPDYQSVLNDWLAGVYLLTNSDDAVTACKSLIHGECLVNQQGDIYTQNSVTYFGAQSLLHGVLERQARLESLQSQLPELQQQLVIASNQLRQFESELHELRSNQHSRQQHLKNITQKAHQLNLSLQQLKQQLTSALQRKAMLEADCDLAQQKLEKLQNEMAQKQNLVTEINASLTQMQLERNGNEAIKHKAENLLAEARSHLQNLERSHQEKVFNIKIIQNNIKELNSKLEFLHEEKTSLKVRCEEVETALNATRMEALKANLETALNLKQQREAALLAARNAMNECQETLMQQERVRLQNEQLLHPLRDKLEASRLNEQQARLYFEQCQAELASFNLEESTLADSLSQLQGTDLKISDLENKKTNLESDIEALGAVNLAAIEELTTEQTRKQYLDSQCHDLLDASQTLEDAIRKIDRETRSRLQATFDEANLHFNELFTTLFGGGQARLVLLGDEILDTGMQVFAQPPGKKNSTIHLLSGGEKALTALALVFALFRLNPAPFCLMDEVDAPLDDSNTERFCAMVKKMSERTQFLYVSHNKITMEMAQQLIGVTMQESGVSRIVDVDMEAAVRMVEA
jgi:chromosome segregation protein